MGDETNDNESGAPSPAALDRLKQAAKIKAEQALAMGDITSEMQKQAFIDKELYASAKRQYNLAVQASIGRNETLQMLQDQIAAETEIYVSGGEQAEAALKKVEALERQKAELEAIHPLTMEQLAVAKAHVDILAEQADKAAEILDTQRELVDVIGDALGAMTGIGDAWKSSATGAFLNKVRTTSFAEALGDVGKAFKKTFTLANIGGSAIAGVIQQTMKLALASDAAFAGFAKATGAGRAYDNTIRDNYISTRQFGVDIGESAAALQGLRSGLAGFNTMSKAARDSALALTSVMGEIGVDANAAAELLTNTTKVMGMTGAGSEQMAANLHGLSKSLEMDFGAITGNFNAVMGDLAIYGKEAPKVFARLAGAMKETGISVDTLVNSMKELDTIQGAAMRAGKLNAALGGQFLDMHELLNASYDERVLMIQEAVAASGKDWETMGRAEKQMIANAAGFSNMADAAKIFGNTSTGALSSAMDAAGNTTGSIEEMQEASKSAQAIQEKWGKVLERLAVATKPLVDGLHFVIDGIAAMMEAGGEWTGWIVLATGLLFVLGSGALAAAWGGVMAFVSAIWSGIAAIGMFILKLAIWSIAKLLGINLTWASIGATRVQTEVTEDLADAQDEQANASENASSMGSGFLSFLKELLQIASDNWKGLLALGAAFLMIGIGIAIAAWGMAQFVKSFAGMSPAQILAISVALLIFGLMIVAIVWILAAAAPAMAGAAAGLLAFGFAVLMVGVAVLLMALAFGMFVDAIIKLVPYAGQLVDVGMGLGVIALAGMLMLPAGFMAMLGLGMLALGLGALAIALAFISTDDLVALGNMFMGLGAFADAVAGGGLSEAVPMIEELMDTLLDKADDIEAVVERFLSLGGSFAALAASVALAMIIIAPSLALLGFVTLAAATAVGFMAVSLVAFSVGANLATAAMLMMISVLPLFFSFLPFWWETLTVFTFLTPVMMMLAGAVMIIALTGFLAYLGLFWLSIGLGMVSDALWSMPLVPLLIFISLIETINSLTDSAINKMYSLADAIHEVADSLYWMSMWRAFKFTMMLHEVGYAGEQIKNITPASVANVEHLVGAAEEYSRVKWTMYSSLFGIEMDPFVNMLKAAGGGRGGKGAAGGGAGGGGPTVVVLELDGKVLGKTVEALLSKRNKLSSVAT